ncbi:MAG: hypothetical protein ACO0C9_07850 [Candidatus Methanosuratincola verstraetei]|jgi:hypothetical protein|uniref:Uncharacterized protein n=1 Tax=Methanosuratincola subterraneus TaxID=2593994 RepID=A0A3S3SSA4_METS7|nr:MAG: hypothetical protein Metus_0464 [Candidatus Methanosuratincola subterraneus]
MDEYSIVDFLMALTEDNFEKQTIKLISEGYTDDLLLEKLLEIIKGEKKC